ncbi:MAG: DoxX family membrane protein [Actinomycetota bacterium]|nr:DoxX family membrane protein [Actinomycetota bacterium]
MTTTAERASPETQKSRDSLTTRAGLAVLRVGVAVLWIENAGWKTPPDFSSLRRYTSEAVEHPVVPPFTWVVEQIVLPNFTFFAWVTLLVEASLGAFLLIGLATRLWAVLGIGQSLAITMSVMNAPNEWEWSFYLMILAHVAVFATAAGRCFGLDEVMRPIWRASDSRLSRLLLRLS